MSKDNSKSAKTEDIGQLIYDETEKRLEEMERPDYQWPARIGKIDWFVIVAAIVICIILIVLCMTGVIV